MTRAYEIAVVLNPELSDAELERLGHALKETIKKHGGEVTKEDVWGRRATAYPLKKHREAYYVFYKVSMDGAKVYTLDQEIKLTPHVLRHLITLQEDTAEEIIEEVVTEEREPRSTDR